MKNIVKLLLFIFLQINTTAQGMYNRGEAKNHLRKIPGFYFECRMCGENMPSQNTTRYAIEHLMKKHPLDYKKFKKLKTEPGTQKNVRGILIKFFIGKKYKYQCTNCWIIYPSSISAIWHVESNHLGTNEKFQDLSQLLLQLFYKGEISSELFRSSKRFMKNDSYKLERSGIIKKFLQLYFNGEISLELFVASLRLITIDSYELKGATSCVF